MKELSRRKFLKVALGIGGGLLGAGCGISDKDAQKMADQAAQKAVEDYRKTSTLEGQTETTESFNSGDSSVREVYRSPDALDYPKLTAPDPSRQPVFPDVPYGNRPALAAYELPFEDGDYFEDAHGDIDLPQYYYRVMTAGTIKIPELDVDCQSSARKGCLVLLVNHFGDTAMFRDTTVDNGFTVAGRVWDMSTPEKTTLAAQALLDHYTGRMTQSEDGANCGTIDACQQVEWHVVMVGNGEAQAHWSGLYSR